MIYIFAYSLVSFAYAIHIVFAYALSVLFILQYTYFYQVILDLDLDFLKRVRSFEPLTPTKIYLITNILGKRHVLNSFLLLACEIILRKTN